MKWGGFIAMAALAIALCACETTREVQATQTPPPGDIFQPMHGTVATSAPGGLLPGGQCQRDGAGSTGCTPQ